MFPERTFHSLAVKIFSLIKCTLIFTCNYVRPQGICNQNERGTGFSRKSNVLVSFTIRRINTNSFQKCFSQYDKKRPDHKQLLGYMEREKKNKTVKNGFMINWTVHKVSTNDWFLRQNWNLLEPWPVIKGCRVKWH